jgi:hypothetical protein
MEYPGIPFRPQTQEPLDFNLKSCPSNLRLNGNDHGYAYIQRLVNLMV